jgi:hypothetical protein
MKKQIFHKELLLALVIVVVIASIILMYIFPMPINSNQTLNSLTPCTSFPKTYDPKDIIIHEYVETKHTYSSIYVNGNGYVNFSTWREPDYVTKGYTILNEQEFNELVSGFKNEFFCMSQDYWSDNSIWPDRDITITVGNISKTVKSHGVSQTPLEFNYIVNNLDDIIKNITESCYKIEMKNGNWSDTYDQRVSCEDWTTKI